jgi:DNA-binding transcriptional LysR family regulator
VDLAIHTIGPLLPEFARQYPNISLQLDLSAKHADFALDQIDLAIRLGKIWDDALVARRIGTVQLALFAAPIYLDLRGSPATPADLETHDCLYHAAAQGATVWRFTRDAQESEVAVRGRVSMNNISLMRVLAERGMGIAMLPTHMVRESVLAGRLCAVLPEYTIPPLPIQVVMPSRLQPAVTRVFIDFIATRLSFE